MVKRWISRLAPLAALSALAAVGWAAPAQADSFTVTNTSDSGGGSLRDAITAATATPGPDTITISATGTLTLASALPDLPDGLTITGPGAADFTVDGNGANRIFLVLNDRTVSISGLTATNGSSPGGDPFGDPNGAGIENEGKLTLDHVTVSNSTATNGNGGGIATESGATLTLTASTVTGNSVIEGAGGGLYDVGTVTIRDSTVSKNSSTGSFSFGGGIEVGSQSGTNGSLTLTGSTVSDNTVSGGAEAGGVGGGIDEQLGSTVTIIQSTISGNQAVFSAGGLRVGGTARVTESTFSNNSAGEFAGGIGVSSMFEFEPGNLTLMNSTVSGNSAGVNGGGIGNFNGATLISDTVASNTAAPGQAANFANEINNNNNGPNTGASFENTIVADPKTGTPPPAIAQPAIGPAAAVNCDDTAAGTTITSNGYNLESDAGDPTTSTPPSCNFTQSTDQSGVDPLLGPLADNGGPTQTRELMPGSPAVDKGTSDGLTTRGFGRITDQRGVLRPVDQPDIANADGGDGSDVGALEVAPPSAVTGPASNVRSTSATISGTAGNPDVTDGQAFFEYDAIADPQTPTQVVPAGANGLGLSASLTGLRTLTTYRYRLVVINADRRTNGAYRTFRTTAGPTAITGPARDVRANSARITGTVNPNGAATTYHFQYGRTQSYGNSTPTRDAGSGGSAVGVDRSIGGLRPGTTYHYRILASNSEGRSTGRDRTFTTPTARPRAVTGRATGVRSTSARIHGTVNPEGARTTYHFRFGRTRHYGNSTPTRGAGSGTSARGFSAALRGLRPATTYHYRIVASNSRGRATGRDRTFRTPRAPHSPQFTG